MQYTTTVTQKGQITLLKSLRDMFGIKPNDKIILEPGLDYIKIKPTKDILDIAGKFHKHMKGKDLMKAREEMQKNYSRF